MKALRLVNKFFSKLFASKVIRTFRIVFPDGHPHEPKQILLSHHQDMIENTQYFRIRFLITTLTIECICRKFEDDACLPLLTAFVDSFANLLRVCLGGGMGPVSTRAFKPILDILTIWRVKDTRRRLKVSLRNIDCNLTVLDAINKIDHLELHSYNVRHGLALQIAQCIARCPSLTDIRIYCGGLFFKQILDNIPIEHQSRLTTLCFLAAIPCAGILPQQYVIGLETPFHLLRNLTELKITDSDQLSGSFWKALESNHIYLQNLRIPSITENVLDYLALPQVGACMKILKIKETQWSYMGESTCIMLARQFNKKVLPNLRNSLTTLTLGANLIDSERRMSDRSLAVWSMFDEDNQVMLRSLTSLTTFHLTEINNESWRTGRDSDRFHLSGFISAFANWPCLRDIIICVEIKRTLSLNAEGIRQAFFDDLVHESIGRRWPLSGTYIEIWLMIGQDYWGDGSQDGGFQVHEYKIKRRYLCRYTGWEQMGDDEDFDIPYKNL